MIKHFGRWVIALLIAVTVAVWLLERAVGRVTTMRFAWAIYVIWPVVTLLVVERLRGAHPGLLSFVTTLVAGATCGWMLFGLHVRWWERWLLLAVVAGPLMSMANACLRADVLQAQRRRDARATRLARAVMAGEPVERFALYLRPFVTSDRLAAQAPPAFPMAEVPVHLDAETLLARGLRATVPVIALGKSGDTVEGAARVTVSDDAWRETVEALARRAEFIVMVPLSRPGTMWELEWLKQSNLLSKIVFIMPEIPHETPSGVVSWQESADRIFDAGVRVYEASAHMLDWQKEWLETERVTRNFGLQFPPLAAVGAVYTMNPSTGAVKDIVPLALTTLARRTSYLRTSVMRLGILPAAKAPVDFLQDFVKAVVWGGRTLEYALMRAGDGFAVWGDAVAAIRLFQRAVEAGQPRPEFATLYIRSLPELMEERVKMGDLRAAVHYAEFAHRALADPTLVSLTTNETRGRIDSLYDTLVGQTHTMPPN